ncbi:MAG: hypothetical protein AAB971_03135 [Patescibacteria group bacterium]
MRRLFPWLAVLTILVIAFGTIYAVTQQAQRRDANYPQIQLAQDTAAALNRGDVPLVLVHDSIDMAKSLAPFTIIYNKSGKVVIGSGYLNGKIPQVPIGVLDAANGKPYHAITWQPETKVRIAAVAVAAKDYYVLSGRSLTEVEKNKAHTLQLTLIGGLISVMLFAVVFILSNSGEEIY